MSSDSRTASYRIDPHGMDGWHIAADLGDGFVRMQHASLPDDDGTFATITMPRAWLIAADGQCPRPTAAAAREVTGRTPPVPRSALAADPAPRETAYREDVGGFPPAFNSLGAPIARNTDPQPAHDAARTAKSIASERRVLTLHAHEAAGERGLTGDELELVTGIDYDVIGPRRPWLVDNGFLVATGARRVNRRGNSEGVYVITDAGREMARKLHAEAQ